MTEAKEIRFACAACPEVVVISDDPANHAAWLREFVTFEGWADTPHGLDVSSMLQRQRTV